MHSETKRIMRSVRSRLTRLVDLENRHCGHDEEVKKAIACRVALEHYVLDQIERLMAERSERVNEALDVARERDLLA